MQGETFSTEVKLLPLRGCDMIFGIQWLSTIGPILWDFKNLIMEFQSRGKPLVLKGESLKVEQVTPRQLEKTLRQTKQGFIAHLCSITTESPVNEVHSDLQVILQEFIDIFDEPKTLPPQIELTIQFPLSWAVSQCM